MEYPILKIAIFHDETSGRLELTVEQLVERDKNGGGATYQRIEDHWRIPLDIPLRQKV